MKGGRVRLLHEQMLYLEAQILQAVIPIEVLPEVPDELEAQAARAELQRQPRRRRRRSRRRLPLVATSVQDVERARRVLKLRGMLKP
jgi:hypothetical protein